ncbi:MAG: hypothetical protein OXN86_05690 [Chloroflexota bacterium]|nr:hypothetical protein [Chloroflexota bacterium]
MISSETLDFLAPTSPDFFLAPPWQGNPRTTQGHRLHVRNRLPLMLLLGPNLPNAAEQNRTHPNARTFQNCPTLTKTDRPDRTISRKTLGFLASTAGEKTCPIRQNRRTLEQREHASGFPFLI